MLFLDPFAEGFSQIGNAAAHAELDSGKAANNQLFWEGVQETFQMFVLFGFSADSNKS